MNSYRKVPTEGNGSEGMINKISHGFVMYIRSLWELHKRNNGAQPSFHAVFGYYRKMLDSNNRAIGIITEMNDNLGSDVLVDINYVKDTYLKLRDAVNTSMGNFDIITQNRYQSLHYVFNYIDHQVKRTIEGVTTGDLPGLAHSTSAGMKNSDAYHKEKKMLEYIAPLNLVDPMFDNFTPEACKTIHDIIRFMHVKSVYELTRRSNGKPHPVPTDYSPALR